MAKVDVSPVLYLSGLIKNKPLSLAIFCKSDNTEYKWLMKRQWVWNKISV